MQDFESEDCIDLPSRAAVSRFTVDLREPVYEDGVLKTEQGGIITGPNLRVQARKIFYTKKGNEENIEAEGDVIIEFSNYLFVGERIEFNLTTNSGILYNGRTGLDPWFFGGEEIHLLPDGNYKIIRGFATTSENVNTEWELMSDEALIEEKKQLTARNVYFRFIQLPMFWMPVLRVNLDFIFDNPIKYTVQVGGSQGPLVGMAYEVFSWNGWKTFIHLDYRTKRGLGGGFETNYISFDGSHQLNTINYIASDTTLYNDHKRTRYRYEGEYTGTLDFDRTTIDLTWDKLSDKDMATDYSNKGINLESAKRTQLHVRREEPNFITNFITRLRINPFQTVKQELPTLAENFRPFQIGNTGIISENSLKLSYLELEYTDGTNGHDYNSPRYELNYNLYRPWHYGNIHFTPKVGGVSIFYGNNEQHKKTWMNIAYIGGEVNTNIYRFYGARKHVITPYIKYQYYCFPSTPPAKHYIFDIDDGWYRLDMMRLGFDQSIYRKINGECIFRDFYFDFWTNLFFDTPTMESTLPILYGKMIHNLTPRLRYSVSSGWDFRDHVLDHANCLIQWTVSNNVAISTEYRHRSSFAWRKVDHNNFFLDSVTDVQDLYRTALSDRRDTLLIGFYCQFHPFWGFQINSRQGWNRKHQPFYNEYEVDLLGRIRSTWHLAFSYKHRQDEDRFSVNFSVGLVAPSKKDYDCIVPCLEF